jgi:hypothetical protein
VAIGLMASGGDDADAFSEAATTTWRWPGLTVAASTSIGAGAIHAAAAGVHAEHPDVARIFVVLAALQIGAGLFAFARAGRAGAVLIGGVNLAAVIGWVVTRITGISWIDGLGTREAPQFADTVCAALGAVAVGAAAAALLVGRRPGPSARLLLPGVAVALLAVPAMWSGGTHVHSHGHDTAATAAGADGAVHTDDGHAHAAGAPKDDATPIAAAPDTTHGHAGDDHAHSDTTTSTVPVEAGAAPWPRPWDPAGPLDLSGVEGVTPAQEARARALVEGSLRELPKYADPADAIADGYQSIGDAGTGSEHYIKASIIQDDVLLDPTAPESLVYTVDGDQRILAGAMYIASARPTDDPELVDWGGPLMQWHNHGDLCWDRDADGVAKVVGVIRDDGTCARGVNTGGANPMVHVWITPHPCGVFAALEGVGAGQAAVDEEERVDMCNADHGHADDHGSGDHATVEPKPYDPTKPIDLSGTPGVTPEQQAAAENLIAITLHDLPKWSDPAVAEAAGFKSIGDGATGHEHYIQWDWINDEIWLDPDFPESLVYQPLPDGTKKLVSAMYMLPDTIALDEVPDIGGALMQWHIHDDLCFTTGDHPRVAGITSPGGTCRAPLVKFQPAPMIHVWITPHRCGPFAALEGVGAGQIAAGEERLCDHDHGGGF